MTHTNCEHIDIEVINPTRHPSTPEELYCQDCDRFFVNDGPGAIAETEPPEDRGEFIRVVVADDNTTVLETADTDLDDEDPVRLALQLAGVEYVSLRFLGGVTYTYSRRAV